MFQGASSFHLALSPQNLRAGAVGELTLVVLGSLMELALRARRGRTTLHVGVPVSWWIDDVDDL
jgi:hypothetical protein